MIDHPSPNHGERRGAGPVDIILLHYTGMETGAAAIERLCDPNAEVSAHYIVEESGRVLRSVAEERRAWHAGQAFWKGETDINSRSIGIEIVNGGHDFGLPSYPDDQIDAVIGLCRDILSRHTIPPERVLGHSDVSPGRKIDPGERFPWDRLAGAGIGHFVPPVSSGGGRFLQEGDQGEPVRALQATLADYGYGCELSGRFDATTRVVVEAFQRHFRPDRVDGIADASTLETLDRLLKALP